MATRTSATRRSRSTPAAPRTAARTKMVWSVFAAACTAVTGLLILGEGRAPRTFLAASTTVLSGGASRADSVLPSVAPLDRGRWTSIVIHHSGLPAGDPESIERQQRANGLSGLGYHFVIGNGRGMGDGEVHTGYRWSLQEPGAHVACLPADPQKAGTRRVRLDADAARELNEHSIGICLVGNGERREFTERQIRELVALIRSLQQELGIPATSVHLHSDLADVRSPGRWFPAASFETQLLP